MIEITLPDFGKLDSDMKVAGSKVMRAVNGEVRSIAYDMVARVKGDKLSGQVLNVRTGRLRRSINARITESTTGIEAKVGTNVEYARAHEFGFKGTVTVKEHMRRGKRVRAHARNVNIPQRSFLRSTATEMRPEIDKRIARAIATGIVRGAA
jgi:phage gpG-like protein